MSTFPRPVPAADADAEPTASLAARRRLEGEAVLRAELIAAVDHDLRTSLTTVLGALQTLARPELAPEDPDLAALVSSGLAQAQKMRRLLDELLAASSPRARPLLSPDLAHLAREAAGEGVDISVDLPAGLAPAHLSAPGLRRALAGILRGARLPGPARVTIVDDDGDCRITVSAGGTEPLAVPLPTARLVATMGGLIEETTDAGVPALRLTFPGACRGQPG